MARRRNNVVSLRGAAIPLPRPNRDVIAYLEDRLVEARDGIIAGIATAVVAPQGHISTGWCGNAEAHSMVAATAKLHHRVLNAQNE